MLFSFTVSIVYSTVCSNADQWKHQSSTSLAFVRGIHRWPVNSPHKWPVTRKMFPFDDVLWLPSTRGVTMMDVSKVERHRQSWFKPMSILVTDNYCGTMPRKVTHHFLVTKLKMTHPIWTIVLQRCVCSGSYGGRWHVLYKWIALIMVNGC